MQENQLSWSRGKTGESVFRRKDSGGARLTVIVDRAKLGMGEGRGRASGGGWAMRESSSSKSQDRLHRRAAHASLRPDNSSRAGSGPMSIEGPVEKTGVARFLGPAVRRARLRTRRHAPDAMVTARGHTDQLPRG